MYESADVEFSTDNSVPAETGGHSVALHLAPAVFVGNVPGSNELLYLDGVF